MIDYANIICYNLIIDGQVMLMLGERLKIARKNANYTQSDIAEYLNVIRQTYSAYETGRSKPDSETLNNLAKIYDVSVDWLLNNTDNPLPPDKKDNSIPYSKTDKSFYKCYESLSEESRKEIENYMNYLVQKEKDRKSVV